MFRFLGFGFIGLRGSGVWCWGWGVGLEYGMKMVLDESGLG